MGDRVFDTGSIHRIINNPIYIGKVHHKGQLYKGQHEAIISDEIWAASRKTLQIAPKARAGITRRKIPAVLVGLLKCGGCGCSMTPTHTRKKNGKIYRYYTPSAHNKGKITSCPIKQVSAPEIESVVLAQLHQMFQTPELLAAIPFAFQVPGSSAFGLQSQSRTLVYAPSTSPLAFLPGFLKCFGYTWKSVNQETDGKVQMNKGDMNRGDLHISLTSKYSGNTLAAVSMSEEQIRDSLQNINSVWQELFPVEQERLLKLMLDTVIVQEDSIELKIKTDGLLRVMQDANLLRSDSVSGVGVRAGIQA